MKANTQIEVDVVYTWVNHNDRHWQELYKAELLNSENIMDNHRSAANLGRFINRNELYYSILSVHKYAPWVRNIYVLTNCEVPAIIKNLKKVIPIHHNDVLAKRCKLPTFNSRAIESSLHHISGLSDHFLYLNDDVFLCSPAYVSDFFPLKNAVNVFPSNHEIPYKKDFSELRPAEKGMLNAAKLLNRDLNYHPKFKLHHAPFSLLKSVLTEIEERYPKEIANTSSHRFRHPEDIPLATTMHAYYCIATGRGFMKPIESRYVDINNILFPILTNRLSPLRRGKYKFLCLNEVTSNKFLAIFQEWYIDHLLKSLFLK